MESKVYDIIKEQLNIDEDITEDTSFKDDLGVDSIDLVNIVMAFEDEFNIEINFEELEDKIKTVGDVIDLLREQGVDL